MLQKKKKPICLNQLYSNPTDHQSIFRSKNSNRYDTHRYIIIKNQKPSKIKNQKPSNKNRAQKPKWNKTIRHTQIYNNNKTTDRISTYWKFETEILKYVVEVWGFCFVWFVVLTVGIEGEREREREKAEQRRLRERKA